MSAQQFDIDGVIPKHVGRKTIYKMNHQKSQRTRQEVSQWKILANPQDGQGDGDADRRMSSIRRIHFLGIGLCTVILMLDACSLGGLGGPYPGVPELVPLSNVPRYSRAMAPPQIIYRIDENRYFEDVPNTPQVCANGSPIYYVDKALGIRSFVVLADAASARTPFTIDAANDKYLIGPMTRGNTDCSSGGGGCGGASMPYSVDAGRTWKRASPPLTSGFELYLVGDALFYAGQKARLSELSSGDVAWKQYYLVGANSLPPLRKPPFDTKFNCTIDGGKP